MLGYLVAGIGIAMIGKTIWMIDDWGRDWSSNHAALSADHPDESLRPIVSAKSILEVENAVVRWVRGESNWAVMSESTNELTSNESDAGQPVASLRRLHLTHTTSILRFVDDVHVQIQNVDRQDSSDPAKTSQTILYAESQSRIGKGDLGQNPRNLRALHRGVLAELAGAN